MLTHAFNKMVGHPAEMKGEIVSAGPPMADAPKGKCPACGFVGRTRVLGGKVYVIGCRCRRPSEGKD